MKLVSIVGARPQFIKAATVSRVLRSETVIRETLIHTGQHYDAGLSDVFFQELEIPRPDHHLGVGSAPQGAQTGRMLERIEEVLKSASPDRVLVYGDTNSTLAGALAAAKLNVSVAHVEAGLRSFNRRMPEEVNRVVTDHVSDLLFAPTEAAIENLRREGISGSGVIRVGDVMYDAALYYADAAREQSRVLDRLSVESGEFILATVHRAENTDSPSRLRAIVEGFTLSNEEHPVVLPLHPRTRERLETADMLRSFERSIQLIEPVSYLDMIELERNSALIVTDSGGVQKEAYFHRVPCVTLRDETEWVELVETGWNEVVPPNSPRAIVDAVRRNWGSSGEDVALYGDGRAATAVVEGLLGGESGSDRVPDG